MAVTIKEIAALVGVSPAAVSLALNGKKGISEETKTQIIRAARELGYVGSAYEEKAAWNKTIRFLRVSMHGKALNRDLDVFISDYIEGLSQGANILKYNLEVDLIKNIPIEQLVTTIKASHLDGIIVLGTELTKKHIRAFSELTIPSVFIDTYDAFLPNNFVDMNNKQAVYQIISYFKEQGLQKIGMVSSRIPAFNFKFRKKAFQEMMEYTNSREIEEFILEVDPTFEGAYEDMKLYLEQKTKLPECFFCANDIIAYGCVKAFKEYSIKIPEDISIIGFDDLPLSSVMEPALTTIQVPKQQMGRIAMTIINDLIESKNKSCNYKLFVDGTLIERSSVYRRNI